MTTPTGNITLGNVATELGIGLPLTIGDARCRALAGVPSGPITLGQLRGKSVAVTPPPPPPPVYPARGTPLGRYCNDVNLFETYADGYGGSYSNVIEFNSPTCGYVAPTPYGTLLRQYCDGTTLVGVFADGNRGEFASPLAYNSTQCGFVPYPAYGTLLYTYCQPISAGGDGSISFYSLMGVFANGSGGNYTQEMEYNSPSCNSQNGINPGGGTGGD